MHLCAFLFILFLETTCADADPDSVVSVFENPSSGAFQHLVVDTKLESGRVYLGAINHLYQLTPDLDLSYAVKTGPEDDVCSEENAQSRQCQAGTPSDNYNKALAIDAKQSKLIACGTLLKGQCEFRNLYNIETQPDTPPPPQPNHVLTPSKDDSAVVLVAPGPSTSRDSRPSEVLYVATTISKASSYEQPAVATLSLERDRLLQPVYKSVESASQIPLETTQRGRFFITYVTAFASGNYTYFISRQPEQPGSGSPIQSKLIRICQNDETYQSYIEVPLLCGSAKSSRPVDNFYNLVQAAYVTKPGIDLANQLGITTNDDVLFAGFSAGGGSATREQATDQSALCVYDLKRIEDIFKHNVLECSRGNQNRGLSFFRSDAQCLRVTYKEDMPCGDGVNMVLGGKIPVESEPVKEYNSGVVMTAVAATTAHTHTVVFVGTDRGRLKKLFIESARTAKEYDDVSVRPGEAILSDMDFDISGSFIYVMTSRAVMKLRVETCSSFADCRSCLAGSDPFCGWCPSKHACAVKSSCNRQWLSFLGDEKCTAITAVQPSEIHVSQSETLHLTVQYLPSLSAGQQLKCIFAVFLPNGQVTRFSNDAVRSEEEADRIRCTTPATMRLPEIPQGEDHLSAMLSIRISNSGPDLAVTNFTFYSCPSFTNCTACVSSPFACDWCVESNQCTHDTEEYCRKEYLVNGLQRFHPSMRKGPQHCPAFHSATNSPVLLAAGTTYELAVRGPSDTPHFMSDFVCVFSSEEPSARSIRRARFDGKELRCDAMLFDFEGTAPNMTWRVDIAWGNSSTLNRREYTNMLDNRDRVEVVVYKCANLKKNCGECLLLRQELRCGWCARTQSCMVRDSCGATTAWLKQGATCSNPEIHSFSPASGPVEGNTVLQIRGINLPRDLEHLPDKAITVNNVPCEVTERRGEFSPTVSLSCVTGPALNRQLLTKGPVVVQTGDGESFSAVSKTVFQYVRPAVTSFDPVTGPRSGGTIVTVHGEHLDAGSNVTVTLGSTPCRLISNSRRPSSLQCKTGRSPRARDNGAALYVNMDGASLSFTDRRFTYEVDPEVDSIGRYMSTVSGGLEVEVTGSRFNLIRQPRFVVYHEHNEFTAPCHVVSASAMLCETPNLSSLNLNPPPSRPLNLHFGLILDNVAASRNLTSRLGKAMQVLRDPRFDMFPLTSSHYRMKHFIPDEYLTIHGDEIDVAAEKSDVKVYVGLEECNLTALARKALTCKPPREKPETRSRRDGHPEVVVFVGRRYNVTIGLLSYDSPLETSTYIAIFVPIVFVVLALLTILAYSRRRASQHSRQMKHLQEQIVNIELKVASECKEAFAELQTDMSGFTADMTAGSAAIPYLSYKDYVLHVMFPSNPHELTTFPLNLTDSSQNATIMLKQLLLNKAFLLTLIRTLEASRTFLGRDRVYVGSLLMIILLEKLDYCTDVLKTLLEELIERTIERKMPPRILFRRSESVAERMLGAWFTFLMHRYLLECAGQPLFMVYYAIKQTVEKGPHDAITHDARYSLSEAKLIRQSVEYRPMTIYLTGVEGIKELPVRVLTCDSISQVKEKCLDAIYKTTPYSQRPHPTDLVLEWHTGVSGRLTLQDVDSTTQRDGGGHYRRINTMSHYKVPLNGAVLALVPHSSTLPANAHSFSNNNEASLEKTTHTSFSTFSLGKGSPSLARTPPATLAPNGSLLAKEDSALDGCKLFHLIKPTDASDSREDRHQHSKLVSEVYLTRLLTTKGTLQKFVEDLFETVFSIAHRGSALPLCVKYMFDFLDEQALQHGITDFETVHAWKSNSLPLRFWVNLIKNPHFVFDVAKPTKIEGCLSVVAQTLMDSCSTQDHQLTKDSPSSKLLFARDIPVYRDWVDGYYRDIRRLPSIPENDMNNFLAEESEAHRHQAAMGEALPVTAALLQLHRYIDQYKEQVIENLEQNELCCRHRLPHKFAQYLRLMESSDVISQSRSSRKDVLA